MFLLKTEHFLLIMLFILFDKTASESKFLSPAFCT